MKRKQTPEEELILDFVKKAEERLNELIIKSHGKSLNRVFRDDIYSVILSMQRRNILQWDKNFIQNFSETFEENLEDTDKEAYIPYPFVIRAAEEIFIEMFPELSN